MSFFRFTSFRTKLWAFSMMQFAQKAFSNVEGQEFYKLLGTGREGFDPKPDFEVYAVLQVWKSEDAANDFFNNATIIKKYRKRAEECYQIFMRNIIARGKWDGQNPFRKSDDLDDTLTYAVITRASIKTKFLFKFWSFVPRSQQNLKTNTGLLYTKGIGEIPFKNMATFSLWKDLDSLNKFAYQTEGHVKAIGKTRELGWYSEELFSRFQPYGTSGSWFGANPLEKA